ncbi:MAG: succinylglutamate desuccinylase/aspartoacylase family protein [Acidimicrobiales bacterium]
MAIPVVAMHGKRAGPTVWLSGAIHGDEVCGVEIIRQALSHLDLKSMAGTVLAVPVVNVPGFASGDRYLPDRRDLNRSFPGSTRGSLASRFAHTFMTEVVERSEVGIDLHTGSDHRANLPQIRADLDDELTHELTEVFAPPVALHARLRDGSLREAAVRAGATTLLYEGGEAWRFDDDAVASGVGGVTRVLHHLGVLPEPVTDVAPPSETRFLRKSSWLRSPNSGVARVLVKLGDNVVVGQNIAVVADAIGSKESVVHARRSGVVIGRNERPVVHGGDALVHIAHVNGSYSR